MARPDPHSVLDEAQPRLCAVDWRAEVDTAARTLVCVARLEFDRAGDVVDLDTRDLAIERVDGAIWELAAPHPFLGQRLRLVGAAQTVTIRYRTSPGATALGWSQGGVYTQCQPIYARTILPITDSPSTRVRIRAALSVPGVIAAPAQPIAPHTFAFAAGDYVARELSPRCRVWAQPALADAAARAFADVERWIGEAERLFGPYPWPRFDLLVAPPSFPHGGMENAQLTFVSPTLVDDEARWATVAHELAHAWSGNLVTAASLEHFWLNEAFAVWGERRMLAALVGRDAAAASAAHGRRQLAAALGAFAALPERTRLRWSLDGVDPDEALSIVPYEKGHLLVCAIEEAVGEARFAAFVRDWFGAARTVTSDDFARAAPVDIARWLDEPGLPVPLDDAPAEAAPLPADWQERLRCGRLAWLRPIFVALVRERRSEVAAIYRAHREGYHPVARQQLERLLREQGIAVDVANPLGLRRRP